MTMPPNRALPGACCCCGPSPPLLPLLPLPPSSVVRTTQSHMRMKPGSLPPGSSSAARSCRAGSGAGRAAQRAAGWVSQTRQRQPQQSGLASNYGLGRALLCFA